MKSILGYTIVSLKHYFYQKSEQQSNSLFMNLLHHFGSFVASIDDTKPDSEMYIDALANKKEPEK